ncbi:MAG TPA: anti-virulence regulator CigR family protein, partial [Pseudomonas sp.]|nr:anti-virulence regulator CigR family protein [Pseudomonas sp.]
HVHIVRGKPLPPGWGKRLNAHQRRYVPHYHGYEWRRTGSDLVLVALATGIVHEILHEVLR